MRCGPCAKPSRPSSPLRSSGVRTVYLGTSEFASTVLERLAACAHRPALIVTRPDRPAGRGRRLQSPPVAGVARELGIELSQPENVNDEKAYALISSAEPDVVIVCAFGALIREPLLSAYEMLNVHPSLLPRWRGAAPIERAVMAGDPETGTSIMRLTAGLDSGPVCAIGREPIGLDDTYGSLAPRLAMLGAGLLVESLDRIERGQPPAFADQDESLVTYAEKITASDRLLDPQRPAVDLERAVRALTPHIGARVALADGTMLGVSEVRLVDEELTGIGLQEHDGRLVLGCVPGALELLVVQPPGKRPMEAGAFLRGYALPSR